MISLNITVRPLGDDTAYLPLDTLTADVACTGGTGAADDPWAVQVQITNPASQPWQGVLRIALPVAGDEPRFFLPGFMYGTNRGEAPLVVDSPCPRLRKTEHFPAAPWWMVRSDRLSHPVALAYAGGRITGFAAPPYFVRHGQQRQAWQPGVTGDFDQYAGFGCSLVPGEVVYTLGYENAPWMFIESHHHIPRQPMGENCFTLQPGDIVYVPESFL